MSKQTVFALASLMAVAAPAAAYGQIGIAAKAGTLGLGGEVSVGLGSSLAIRAGYGYTKYEYTGTFEEKEYTVNTPDKMWHVGVDFYPGGGGFRIGAGIMNREAFTLAGTFQGSTEVGGRTYSGTVNLNGIMENESETAPYVLIGFGRTTKSGIGLFLDIGAANLGDADIQLTGTCTTSTGQNCASSTFNADVNAEADEYEEDLGTFLKIHPILQIGLKIAVGGR